MKIMKNMLYLYSIIFLASCQMADVPNVTDMLISVSREPVETEVVQITAEVYQEPEYEYTIIGTWAREFDGHVETYVFDNDTLITCCDGLQNGLYVVEYGPDWTFILSEIGLVFDYELLHDVEIDVLILNGYSYRMVR